MLHMELYLVITQYPKKKAVDIQFLFSVIILSIFLIFKVYLICDWPIFLLVPSSHWWLVMKFKIFIYPNSVLLIVWYSSNMFIRLDKISQHCVNSVCYFYGKFQFLNDSDSDSLVIKILLIIVSWYLLESEWLIMCFIRV